MSAAMEGTITGFCMFVLHLAASHDSHISVQGSVGLWVVRNDKRDTHNRGSSPGLFRSAFACVRAAARTVTLCRAAGVRRGLFLLPDCRAGGSKCDV